MRLLVSVALLAATWAVSLVSPAAAHFELSLYTKRSCSGSEVDPVTNVYWGVGSAAIAANHLEHHLAWRDTSGSPQVFLSHGACFAAAEQRASGRSTSTRYHTRLSGLLDTTPWEYGAGSAHHEDWVWYCGHAVDKTVDGWSGFDMGRSAIYQAMRGLAHHEYSYVNYGNTRQFRQCDGDDAGSNGLVGWWRMPDWSH